MSSRRRQITLQPKVLRWARERAGLSQKTLADKMKVKLEHVTEWEETGRISIARTDNLAAKTYTPLGYLYLSEPPDEPLPIRDFRTHSVDAPARPSIDLLDTVYLMQRRQSWMRDDLIEGGADPLDFVGVYSLTDSHTEVAAAMRSTLRLSASWAESASSWRDALRFLRNRLDEVGVLVVFNGVVGNNNYRKLDRKEFQGFALVDEYAPLVFVNSADYIAAQMFTLAHEVAHLFVGQTGLTLFDKLVPSDHETERYCNQVAAEFLVPKEELEDSWPAIRSLDNPFQAVSRNFKVSAIVAARRALDLELIDRDTFFDFYRDYRQQGEGGRFTGEGGNFWNIQKWRIGPRFAGAVARATGEGRLLHREAYSLTGLRGDTFESMSEELGFIL